MKVVTPEQLRGTLRLHRPVKREARQVGERAKERDALIQWIAEMGCTHAMTLNVNRDVSIDTIRSMFGQFCKRVDELRFGVTSVQRIYSFMRFSAIAFAEHLDSNPHLHVAARLDWMWLGRPFTSNDKRSLDRMWRSITKGAGSTLIEELGVKGPADGWSRYITKVHRPGMEYFLSHDFHPNDSVIKSKALQDVLHQLAGNTASQHWETNGVASVGLSS